jgi:hypothetical protein
MHQMAGKVLRTLLHKEPPQDMTSTKEYINESLSIAMNAMRAAIHSTLGSSPGSLAFKKIKSVVNTTMSLNKGYLRIN